MLTVYVETWATYVQAVAPARRRADDDQPGQRTHQRAPVCVGGQHRCWSATCLRE